MKPVNFRILDTFDFQTTYIFQKSPTQAEDKLHNEKKIVSADIGRKLGLDNV